ncbi:MAG TPA: DUF2098 domain-containing protein [Methanospirillum sp.]|nr:DUF2098 domain-containing protein [Methanospirillum sp.]
MEVEPDVGSSVRYPRTGTTGVIIRIEKNHGFFFAELDTTGMLYRLDQLVPADKEIHMDRVTDPELTLKEVTKDRDQIRGSDYKDTFGNLDGACSGAG